MEKERVLIVGANSFLGQHVVKELQEDPEDVINIRTYDLDQPFQKSLEYSEVLPVERFHEELGRTSELRKAVSDATAVINCLDYQDLRLLPDAQRIHRINYVLVADLAQAVTSSPSVRRVVHMSSLLVGASYMAPSVFPTELSTSLPSPWLAVFPDYTRAKQQAEAIWEPFEDLTVFTLRLPMVYGEGDKSSFIMDVLRYCNNHGGTCPLIKRPHGKMQYAYAGNMGHGVVKALRKMRGVDPGKKEIVSLVDNTPTLNTWDWVEPFCASRGFQAPARDWPFYGFYVPWRVAEVSAWLLDKVGVTIPERVRQFPGSGLLYIHFFYWYFWSGVKARLYLDFVPKYDEEESIRRSVQYYKTAELDPPPTRK